MTQQTSHNQNYVAFISYSHKDKRFAVKLHQRLEFFRLPKELLTSIDNERLGKVYLDKEELGAAYDLPEAIERALAASESLIVVASHNSLNSRWVKKEIAAFRHLRSDGRIFCIAAPKQNRQSFDQLFVVEDDPYGITTHLIDMPKVPLTVSVDEMGFEDASLAIIAGLLGFNFDNLRNRARLRQRKILRLWVIAASSIAIVILILGMLSFVAAIKATREKNRALVGQSELLATQSNDALKAGDATLAVRLALAALPSETQQRPYTWQAAVALSRATQQLRERQSFNYPGERLMMFAPSAQQKGRHFVVSNKGVIHVHELGGLLRNINLDLLKPAVDSAFYLGKQGLIVAVSQDQIITWSEQSNAQTVRKLPSNANCIVPSPDENTVTVTFNDRIELLNLPDLVPHPTIQTIRLERMVVGACAAFSPKYGRILVASMLSGSSAHVLELIDAKTLDRFKVGSVGDVVSNIVLDPTERTGVVAVLDHSLSVVDLAQGEVHNISETLSPKLGLPVTMTHTANGQLLLVGDDNGVIHVFDTAARQRKVVFSEHTNTVWSIYVDDKDGAVYSASNEGGAKVWTLEPMFKQQVLQPSDQRIFDAIGSPSGRFVITGTFDGRASVWDLSGTMGRRSTYHLCHDVVRRLALSEPFGLVAAGCDTGEIFIAPIGVEATPTPIHSVQAPIYHLEFDSRGNLLFAARNGEFGSIDRQGRVTLASFDAEAHSIVSIPGTPYVLVTDQHGDGRVYDFQSKSIVCWLKDAARAYPKSSNILSSIVSSSGKYAWISGSDDRLRGWELNSGILVANFPNAHSLTAGFNDRLVFLQEGKMHLWEPNLSVPRVIFGNRPIFAIGFLPGYSERIATTSIAGEVNLWEVKSGTSYAIISPVALNDIRVKKLIIGSVEHPYIVLATSDGLVLADMIPPTVDLVALVKQRSPSASRDLNSTDLKRFFLPMDSILAGAAEPVFGYPPIDGLIDRIINTFGKSESVAAK